MKKTTFLLSAPLLAGGLLFSACHSDERKESRTEVALERTGDAMKADAHDVATDVRAKNQEIAADVRAKNQEVATDFRKDRDQVVADMRKEQRAIDVRADSLRADMRRDNDKIKARNRQKIATLEARRVELDADITKANQATADAWQDIKQGFKNAGNRLKE